MPHTALMNKAELHWVHVVHRLLCDEYVYLIKEREKVLGAKINRSAIRSAMCVLVAAAAHMLSHYNSFHRLPPHVNLVCPFADVSLFRWHSVPPPPLQARRAQLTFISGPPASHVSSNEQPRAS